MPNIYEETQSYCNTIQTNNPLNFNGDDGRLGGGGVGQAMNFFLIEKSDKYFSGKCRFVFNVC